MSATEKEFGLDYSGILNYMTLLYEEDPRKNYYKAVILNNFRLDLTTLMQITWQLKLKKDFNLDLSDPLFRGLYFRKVLENIHNDSKFKGSKQLLEESILEGIKIITQPLNREISMETLKDEIYLVNKILQDN